jgi:imidazolonepropionase-like amidohydrolase
MRSRYQIILGALLLMLLVCIEPMGMAQGQTSPPIPKPTSILIENVRVFDGISKQLSPASNVLVVRNKIEKISTASISAPPDTSITQINGGGRVLMPGLIDNHVHIPLSASTREDLENPSISAEIIQTRAIKEAEQMLLRGFTSVRDMGGPIFPVIASIDQGESIGPRIYPSGAIISQTSGHGDSRLLTERSRRFGGTLSRSELLNSSFIADGRDEVLTAVRENLRFGASQIKVMAGGGAATLYDPLDVSQYTLDEMKAAVEAADDWNTYVAVHAYTKKSVRRAIEAGVKCIEHGQLLDERTMKLIAKKGIWLSLQVLNPAPSTAPDDVRKKKQQVIDGTDNAFTWAKKYDVNLAWGTDFLFTPSLNKDQNDNILKLDQWFTPAEVLKLVTSENAKLLALSGERNPYPGKLGVIQQGAYADMLLLDRNPLEDLSVIADYANGFKVIIKDGKIYKNTMI